jgi:hypothetical protein
VKCHFLARYRIENGGGDGWRYLQLSEPPIERVVLRSSWLGKTVSGEGGKGVTAGQVADLLEFQVGGLYLDSLCFV